VSGGEAQLGQTAGDAAERGEASAGAGNGGAEAGVARGKVLSGTEMAGAAHMAGRTEEREREVDEGGPNCNFRETQGPYYNASITFKPVLKWRWAQKQKCIVFQNVQLCFKVHPQKS
jgi:hypothetical protein